MRVLLAIDGSPSSEAARRTVGSLNWPEGTIIEVLGVVEPIVDVFPAAGMVLPAMTDERSALATEVLRESVVAAAAELEATGRVVRPVVVEGRAASAIVDRATRSRAELVVVGSRGLGPLKSMVLGSVSAEVVDHAPCPVLVVRRAAVGSMLLAVDGSASSEAAVTFLAGTRFLAGRPVEVLCVGPADNTPDLAPVPGYSGPAVEAMRAAHRAHREQSEGVAARAAEILLGAGCGARWSISEGNAAHEIIEAASQFGCDLVVLGSRGHTGLARVMLGSVARNVLLHTDASVLIVREPVRKRLPVRPAKVERAVRPTVVEVAGA